MKPRPLRLSRRQFIGAGATAAAPFILPSRIWSAETKPNDRIQLGFVGMGTQNRGLLDNFMRQSGTQAVAVCEVDTTRREAALRQVERFYSERADADWAGCQAYVDFREITGRDDIDAVVIATPDHWHAIITIAALESGKDVYCEKPLTHNIHEGVAVMAAVEKHKRVLQTGSMQRSMTEFRVACELVRNGHIGKVERIECSFGPPGKPCDLPEEALEPGLDWDFWLGPAPERPYNSTLSPRGVHRHFPSWRDYREYGGGMVTDWGAHHLDIAQWGLGMDESGPVESIPPKDGGDRGATLVYSNGVTVKHGGDIGVRFHGEDGEVAVDRGRFAFVRKGEQVAQFLGRDDGGSLESALAITGRDYLADPEVKLYRSNNHIRDFLACMSSRAKPITHEGVGAHTAICCHLMNLAYYHGEKLRWDPSTFAFTGGTGNADWLTRDYRGVWKVT
ncbi:MAG TPA: Gfo/Idh/MocA family oxidoreductase [Verrucomicrobiales bacterium]|nr:Gfo/Idh/MocA family oxidoreductase [Verrucomicrobiales bacterium]